MKCISREISDYTYEVKSDGETIVYSPILNMAKDVTTCLDDKDRDALVSQLGAMAQSRVAEGKSAILQIYRSPMDMDRMTILPNFRCNFNCSYCYAAMGRSEVEMQHETLDVALDWFLDKGRLPGKSLYLHIVGGGEPIMSWSLVEAIVKKSSVAAKERGQPIDVAMTTNGSLITEDKAQFLAQSNVLVNVSYEVIREVQNLQRGKCDDVENGILALQRAGARLAIRSTISPVNVDRMPEMVDVVLKRFPSVRRLNLEAVMAGKPIFDSSESLYCFLAKFHRGFEVASKRGAQRGLNVVSAARLDFGVLKERFCQGDLCLTPLGDIVVCHRVSSPKDGNYSRLVFGHIKDGRMMIDEDGYRQALRFSLDNRSECAQCFLRWHCGGLCIAKQVSFPFEYFDALCDSAREEGFAHLKNMVKNDCQQLGVPAHSQRCSDMARSDYKGNQNEHRNGDNGGRRDLNG